MHIPMYGKLKNYMPPASSDARGGGGGGGGYIKIEK